MPDYNRPATTFWWTVVGLGAAGLITNLGSLRGWTLQEALQIAAGAGFAILLGLFPVRLPGTKQSFVAGDIFIFLLLLMQGPAAAALAAGTEALGGSWRGSRRSKPRP